MLYPALTPPSPNRNHGRRRNRDAAGVFMPTMQNSASSASLKDILTAVTVRTPSLREADTDTFGIE